METPLISADSHVNEPGDLWVERIDKAFRDRVPRVVENPPGLKPGAYFMLDGIPPVHLAQCLGAGKKPEELPTFFQSTTYQDARPGGQPGPGLQQRRLHPDPAGWLGRHAHQRQRDPDRARYHHDERRTARFGGESALRQAWNLQRLLRRSFARLARSS